MPSKNKKPAAVEPVIVVMLGVIFIAIVVFKPASNSIDLAADSGAASQMLVAFITGITIGGLSCLAVQGGLLASSLAHQVEQDYAEQTVGGVTRGKKSRQSAVVRTNSALPIFLFLAAKVIAYALLGLLGSFLTFARR